MSHDLTLQEIKKEYHGTLKSYLIGFVCSLILTCLSFYLVAYNVLPYPTAKYVIVGLALAQAILQLLLFLHLGQEERPKWESLVFYFMLLVLAIIVGGSLWIMRDLDNRVMANMQKEMPHD